MSETAEKPKYTPEELDETFGPDLERYVLAAKRQLRAIESRDDILKFMQFLMPDPEHADDADFSRYSAQPHHRLLADALHQIERGENLRLLISMPPQNGKSQILSRGFPAWYIGKHPYKNLMLGTYNQTFAEEFGEDVRNIMQSPQYGLVFPRLALRTGSKSKDHMVTEDGGKLAFLGRGGSGTGRPADGFIIDDPIKDAKEAESLTTRNDIWNWFTRVASSRLHSLSWVIIIMTRWNEDDLIGRLTDPTNPHYNKDVADQYTYINIPAIMDNEAIATALGKKVGDALWPERFSLKLLETARKIDPVGFSALHMGKPTPPEGAYFKAAQIVGYEREEFPKVYRCYGTGDLAVSPEIKSDKSCVGNWALDEKDVLWLHWDLYWERKSSDQSVEQIIYFIKQYGWFEGFFEKGQLDRAIGPFMEKRMTEEKVHGTPLTKLPSGGSKGQKALSIRGRMAQGKVRFPTFAPWWPAAKDEILKFTGSGSDLHDDFVDMCSLIGQALGEQIVASGPRESNVVTPKVGTLAWTKWAHNQERKHEVKRRALAGM